MESDGNTFRYAIGDIVYAPTIGTVLYILRLRRSEITYEDVIEVENEYFMKPNRGEAVWYAESHIEEMLSEGWQHQTKKH